MLTIGTFPLRALCRFARPLPRPDPRWRSVAAGRSDIRAYPSAAPVATPSNSARTARISGTESSAATKCISDVPGFVKHVFTPPSTSVRSRAWAPLGISALPQRRAAVVEGRGLDARDRRLAGETERGVEVGLHHLQDMAHAGLAACGHRPRPRAPDEHGARSERDHLEHVDAGADAAVREHLDVVA